MKKDVMGYPYEIKDIILDKASMSLIELPNQRHIRDSQVNSIFRCLKQGRHFDSMFVVNVNNGKRKIRVIDGGHRTEALKKYFDINVTMEMLLNKYEELFQEYYG